MENNSCCQQYEFELKNCSDCGKPTISFGWCVPCENNATRENFRHWTSGRKEIDELIRHTQLNASQICDYLEWIPFEKFELVKYIDSGGFSSIYSAFWMEGPRLIWDNSAQEWTRTGPTKVALKRLDNSQNISNFYIDQIKAYHKCLQSASLAETFGITKDPTSNYMIVMKYYDNGNLYQYLDRYGFLSWRDTIDILWGIAEGLERIHVDGKVHKNLHGGNLLVEKSETDARIGDVGLHGPCYNDENKSSNQIYGVLPYIAPEVLRGENYSTASDIYSFGIVMNTLATGKRPWCNRAHDINLAKDICNGERPEIPEDTPTFYAELMRKCWDSDPKNRPTASYLNDKLGEWVTLICDDPNPSGVSNEYTIAEEKRWKIIQMFKEYIHPMIHFKACYTSRPFKFPELSNYINYIADFMHIHFSTLCRLGYAIIFYILKLFYPHTVAYSLININFFNSGTDRIISIPFKPEHYVKSILKILTFKRSKVDRFTTLVIPQYGT